jgi:uncharacterized membrane protein YcaP (DUF421 family)
LVRDFDWHGMWWPQAPPWEVALRATVIYFFIIALFRAAGRKELSRYATHDIILLFLITTAARQSIVGTDTSLTTAFVGLATIIGWNWLASYAAARSSRAATVIDGPVRRLIANGRVDDAELGQARLSREELTALLRRQGRDDLSDVKDAYLERSGRVTFILARAREE